MTFLEAFAAEVAAGVLIAIGVYFLVEIRLRLRRTRAEQEKLARAVLQAIREELVWNREQASDLLTVLPRGEITVPGFDLAGSALIGQLPALTALDDGVLNALVRVYARLRTADADYQRYHDHAFGSTGAIVHFLSTLPSALAARGDYETIMRERREALTDRVRELKHRLDDVVPLLDAALA